MAVVTATPATLDLRLYAGDGFSVQFRFVDKETGEPWPTDGTWAAQVRATTTATEVLADWAVVVDDVAGTVTIGLSGEQVRDIADHPGAVWDLEQTAPGGDPRTWYRGGVVVAQDVTRV